MCLEIQKTEPRNGARRRLEGGIKEFLDFILAAGVKWHLRGSIKKGLFHTEGTLVKTLKNG